MYFHGDAPKTFEGWNILKALSLICLAYLVPVFIYRRFFHPLRAFPGPRLASISYLYKGYHDVIKHGGMLRCLERLHEQYGPINSTFTKEPYLYAAFSLPDSSFTSTDPRKAKARRDMLGQFFSRSAILKLEGAIQEKVDKLVSRLLSFPYTKPVDVHNAFRCLTHDIIASYCFAQSFDTLDVGDFSHPVILGIMAQLPAIWTMLYFPFLSKLPESILRRTISGFEAYISFRTMIVQQIDHFLAQDELLSDRETVYQYLLWPENKRHEPLSGEALISEGNTLTSAGSETVANTCTVGTFHVLNNPYVRAKLVEELSAAWPERDSPASLGILEKLPYLNQKTAVIKESLRMSVGVVTPLPRVVGPEDSSIGGVTVPAGTVIAMGASFVHFDPTIFRRPHEFSPERWLDDAENALGKYLVSFSRGPRICLGLNLAWAELYLTFGNIFRKVEMELHNTTIEDIEAYDEFIVPVSRGKHLHAFVKGTTS